MRHLSIILLLFSSSLFSQLGYEHYFNYKVIDTNNISASFTNYGNLKPDIDWKLLNPLPWIVFDAGPWIIGKYNGTPAAAFNQWTHLYSPGPIINGQAGMIAKPEDSLTFRIYKISKGDDNSNPDYAQWPDTLGAPVNRHGDPLIYGDQTLWTVYNGLDSTLNARQWYDTSLPVEIRQLIFARAANYINAEDIFSNTIFLEYTIINKSDKPIDSAYFGFWSDIDFGMNYQNIPSVDSAAQIAYCWNDTTSDLETAPAIGFQLLYGPIISATGDTAIFKGRKLPDYKNLPMTSFHGIGDDADPSSLTGSIQSLDGAWNAARGFDLDGNIIINPVTNTPTKFPFNGDPVTQQGWYQFPTNWVGGGAGVLFFSGPFNFAPQDTQWAMIALIPGLGNFSLESITKMREKAAILRSLPYDSLSGISGFEGDGEVNIPDKFLLYQNYPNPFNPTTKISFDLPSDSRVTLKVFDILGQEVVTLLIGDRSAGRHSFEFNASDLSSGVYIYRLQTAGADGSGFVDVKKMMVVK